MSIGTHLAAHWLKYVLGLVAAGAGTGGGLYIRKLRKERAAQKDELLAAYKAKTELEEELEEAKEQLKESETDGALRGEKIAELEKRVNARTEELSKVKEQIRQLEFTNVQLTAAIKVAEAQANAPAQAQAQTKNIHGNRARGAAVAEPAAATGD